MGVLFRSSATADDHGGITISKPSGAATGDLLIVNIGTQEVLMGDGAVIAAPSGWTDLLTGETLFGSTYQAVIDTGGLRWFWYVGYRIVAGGDPSSWTWTVSNGTPGVHASIGVIGEIVAYQDPDATTPIVVIGSPAYSLSGPTGLDFAGLAPGENDTLIVNVALSGNPDTPGYVAPDDESITAVDDTYSTSVGVPISISTGSGVVANDTYVPGHLPNNTRADIGGEFMEALISDYPWHPSTGTGSLHYGGATADMYGTLVVALRGADQIQTSTADLVVTKYTHFTSPFVSDSYGDSTIATDGSFTYDPLDADGSFNDDFTYQITTPTGKFDRALVTILLSAAAGIFCWQRF